MQLAPHRGRTLYSIGVSAHSAPASGFLPPSHPASARCARPPAGAPVQSDVAKNYAKNPTKCPTQPFGTEGGERLDGSDPGGDRHRRDGGHLSRGCAYYDIFINEAPTSRPRKNVAGLFVLLIIHGRLYSRRKSVTHVMPTVPTATAALNHPAISRISDCR